MAFQPLFQELAVRGHRVTVINNYPDSNPEPNLKYVDISLPSARKMPVMSEFENISSKYLHISNYLKHFILSKNNVEGDCDNLFTNPNMRTFLSEGERFDVIFVEQFMSDCGLVLAGTMYDAPIIGITSHTLLPWAYSRLGISFDVLSDAFYFSNVGTQPSLLKSIENYYMHLYMNTIGSWKIQRIISDVFKRHAPNATLDFEMIVRDKMKMMFVYQHFSVTGARSLPPQLVEIAGIHIKKPKPVSRDIEKFLSSAKHGAIYVSFGSNLKSSLMSEKRRQAFLDAFKKIPQKILWKLENGTLPDGNDNILTSSWFPQLDVLCHPKVRGFISHGGMLSLSEAAYCGKPILAMPFFGDQFSNVAAIEESGLGLSMYFNEADSASLVAAINKLTSNEMQHKAERISKIFNDRPLNVMDNAIYWTEYVAKYRDVPKLPAFYTPWYRRLILDAAIITADVGMTSGSSTYLVGLGLEGQQPTLATDPALI
ncbi:UDP-glycosyltransferase UGT42A2 precursor [Danaus plexippus plexippus]|uniref:UDP-glucuronosyltransferase n=1 Tax=Danaus plexippus plexippus TaxID=278856 RepID=A0A212EKS8_DANPL|nr:UDP-glycosyltransferase UGT42A2 precursor [Danaus plexippus plexippus]